MLEFRLKSLKATKRCPCKPGNTDLSEIDFDDLIYYQKCDRTAVLGRSSKRKSGTLPTRRIRFQKLNVLSVGASAQYESEVVYHNMKEDLKSWGLSSPIPDSSLKEYPDLFKHFRKLVHQLITNWLRNQQYSLVEPSLCTKRRKSRRPLQTYFRINLTKVRVSFRRTLIIVDEGAVSTV